MTIKSGARAILLSLLSDGVIRYGDPQSFSGLTLVPLFSPRRAPFDYTLLANAVRSGTAVVEEVAGGSVPTLRVVNRGEIPVLLVDGEHLIGVKQNRILNTTILVPEKSALNIPVSCVERGRWGQPQGAARPISPMLFTDVRAKKTAAVTASVRRSGAFVADQGAIWDDVARKFTDLEVPCAPTAAMHAAYAHRAADFARYVEHLARCPGQSGVVAVVGSRVLCADLFDRPESLEGLWDRLIPSYAAEAIGRPADGASSVAEAEAFLREAAKAHTSEHRAVGRGTDLRLSGDHLVGAALEADAAIVHVALFRSEQPAARSTELGFATVAHRLRQRAVPVRERPEDGQSQVHGQAHRHAEKRQGE